MTFPSPKPPRDARIIIDIIIIVSLLSFLIFLSCGSHRTPSQSPVWSCRKTEPDCTRQAHVSGTTKRTVPARYAGRIKRCTVSCRCSDCLSKFSARYPVSLRNVSYTGGMWNWLYWLHADKRIRKLPRPIWYIRRTSCWYVLTSPLIFIFQFITWLILMLHF